MQYRPRQRKKKSTFGQLLGIEEGKGEAYATRIDVRCSDRNRVIAEKRIKWQLNTHHSVYGLQGVAESQQYGNYHEIAALAAIQQPALVVFVGDQGKHLVAYPKEELRQQTGRSFFTVPSDYAP